MSCSTRPNDAEPTSGRRRNAGRQPKATDGRRPDKTVKPATAGRSSAVTRRTLRQISGDRRSAMQELADR